MIFGVKDSPRTLVGLLSTNFETKDEATISSYLNGTFSPELIYEKFILTVQSKKIGIIYSHEIQHKPVIAIKNDGVIKEADIYYRYNATNGKIKYPELKGFFEKTREEERENWMNMFEKISKIGPENAGIVDTIRGTIEGKGGSLLIDSKLVPKLKFIKEGHFSEKGKIALKVVGDILPVSISRGSKNQTANFRLTSDPTAIAVREETILRDFPWDYAELKRVLSSRYSDFKLNNRFYNLKRKIMENGLYSHARYLDIKNSKGRKDYYNPKILNEFDKHYTQIKKRVGK
ncbi:MAG TPA: RNA-binding domain-containing protein [Candidatus Paceibacterota bacterium]|nr:RNA-binding domain-containing protein [Candidatus Paceibacterota bacterium]